jgi:sirohydrochlorin ferrochelatase
MNKTGILLVAHGSVVKGAEADLWQLAGFLREKTGALTVEVGFLDYTVPSIPEAVKVCAAKGLTDLLAVPYFLSDGFLCKKALRLVQEALEGTGINMHVTKPLGGRPEIVEAMIQSVERADLDSK